MLSPAASINLLVVQLIYRFKLAPVFDLLRGFSFCDFSPKTKAWNDQITRNNTIRSVKLDHDHRFGFLDG